MATENRDAAIRLTPAQRRHLIELYGDGTRMLYWKMTHGSPAWRTAENLRQHGLVSLEGSIISRSGGGYALTAEGRRVAEGLIDRG